MLQINSEPVTSMCTEELSLQNLSKIVQFTKLIKLFTNIETLKVEFFIIRLFGAIILLVVQVIALFQT